MFMQLFTTKSCRFTKILRVKTCVSFKYVVSSRSENTGPATRYLVKSSQMRNGTPLQL